MSADSLFTLLLLGSIVSGAMLLVLLVARQGLGSASEGTGAWITGDVAHAIGRALLVGSLTPGFMAAWQDHVGPWLDHQLAASLHAVALGCQVVALRQLGRGRVPAPWVNVMAGGLLFAVLVLLLRHIDSLAARKAAALGLIALGNACVIATAWPLARRSWGARLLLLVCGVTAAGLVARLAESALAGQGPGALGATPQRQDFVGELVSSLSATMAFVLIQQERLRERIAELGVTDALTGATNRAGLLPMLRRELAASRRSGMPLSLVLFDLDHFKRINDGYGHGAGDIVLREVAALIRRRIRPRDALCRWGGEEFLLMLPEQRGEAATLTARRIVQALHDTPIDVGGGNLLAVTISAGVATLDDAPAGDGPDGPPIDPFIAEADRRLYQAKVRRDCVVSHRAEYAPALTAEEAEADWA